MSKRLGIVTGLAAAVCLFAGAVQAQGAPPPAPPPGPPPATAAAPPPPTENAAGQGGARTHDGFFLRFGLNLGWGSLTETYELNGVEGDEISLSGVGTGFDLLIGGTPVPGLVIGGALITSYHSNPKWERNGEEVPGVDGTMIFAAMALFVNYYFDPGEGLHLQALAGFSAIDFVSDEGRSGGNDPTGFVVGAGVGYDFWIGDEWSIGPFGRFLFASMSAEAGPASANDTFLYPSLGVAITLH